MKKFLSFLTITAFFSASAQQITWSGDVAEILYKNCTSCHNPNGIAPFSLMNYNDAATWASTISYAVQSGNMPPWKADTSYQRFAHERILSQSERNKIVAWVNNNSPSGDLAQAPAPPVYPSDGYLGPADLEVQMPVYTSKATATADDYICIALPSGLAADKKIRAVEVIPGNRNIVHHTLVFLDSTRQYQTDTTGGDCGGPSAGTMVTGYAPGGNPTIFPNGNTLKAGITMRANSNVILAMHYPEGSAGQKDSTKVRFYFFPDNEPNVRSIKTAPLLQKWNFCIDPNTVQQVNSWFPSATVGLQSSYSALSVFPHMHLLGKSIRSYAVNSSGTDTVPLIDIPHWDFEWQDFYYFKKIQKLPKTYRIYGEASYDNRSTNPHNPHNPPQRVCAGLNTSDEMFLFYFHYMPYQTGDENIDLESLMQMNIGERELNLPAYEAMRVFPNPASEQMNFQYELPRAAWVNLKIYDTQGKLVKTLLNEKQEQGRQTVNWEIAEEPQSIGGLYFYSMGINGKYYQGTLLIK